jgi:hypothetical protein
MHTRRVSLKICIPLLFWRYLFLLWLCRHVLFHSFIEALLFLISVAHLLAFVYLLVIFLFGSGLLRSMAQPGHCQKTSAEGGSH